MVAAFPSSIEMLALSQILHAFSFALFHTVAISTLYSLYTARRLSQQFFFGISYGLGGFIGALGSGILYEYMPNYLFVSASVVAALAAFSFWLNGQISNNTVK
jgi:PPP family 3-phenylpropionic acid transporter